MEQSQSTLRHFFAGQTVHLLVLGALVVVGFQLVDFNRLQEGRFLGIGTRIWFVIAISVPIIHQVFVWLAWRSELCFGLISRSLGSRGFVIYKIIFLILLLARPTSLILLAISDHDSLVLSIPARMILCLVLGVPATYALYSVVRYFGLDRAVGIDHFDASYRNVPFVKQGMFKYSSNSMYVFAFLILWVIAIAAASGCAIVVALFSHAYIWVHYFCTELPDIKSIYG